MIEFIERVLDIGGEEQLLHENNKGETPIHVCLRNRLPEALVVRLARGKSYLVALLCQPHSLLHSLTISPLHHRLSQSAEKTCLFSHAINGGHLKEQCTFALIRLLVEMDPQTRPYPTEVENTLFVDVQNNGRTLENWLLCFALVQRLSTRWTCLDGTRHNLCWNNGFHLPVELIRKYANSFYPITQNCDAAIYTKTKHVHH